MIKRLHKAGLIVSASIPVFILPARITEGQWKDPVNLIGSEIVIFIMCLACWYTIMFIQNQEKLPFFVKLALSVLACCVLSNLFFFAFNPYFKDFPFRTVQNPLHIRILMLSSRGVLMSVILIPAAYYIRKDHEARKTRLENERLVLEKFQIQNSILEQTVFERTRALQDTLSFLKKSQDELEYQFYIQSRLVASITHDIREPFKYLLQVSEEIVKLAAEKEDKTLNLYTYEQNEAVQNMYIFIKNLLEFTKLPLKEKVSRSETVKLSELIAEKSALFKGIIGTNNNELIVDVEDWVTVESNYSLLGIVLHNLIDNANKYTRAGIIELKALVEEGNVFLTVSNSGFAIPADIVEWINSEQKWTDADAIKRNNQTQGIGLVLIKEVSAILDVGLRMHSNPQSTLVQLTFLRENHE